VQLGLFRREAAGLENRNTGDKKLLV